MRGHLFSSLLCLGRHTITGLITTSGRHNVDWSADYRLYQKERFEESQLFGAVRKEIESHLEGKAPLVVAMDDTILRKRGRKIPGTSYRRDPLGPKFGSVNLVLAQRVIQLSAAVPTGQGGARLVPIDFIQAPTLKRPKKNATADELKVYKEKQKQAQLNQQGVNRIQHLRTDMDKYGSTDRELWMCVDGSYTNKTVIRSLPQKTVLIGRIRGDAKLFDIVHDKQKPLGRNRVYGDRLPTPEALLKDDETPWQKIPAFAAGEHREFKVKCQKQVLWQVAGQKKILQLVVIAPLGYRLRQGGKLLYRQPAYIICTDPTLAIEKLLQAYLWRWDIEVNFRDEKTLLGLGQAQVRNACSVQKAPALTVVAYASLLLAAINTFGANHPHHLLPPPKWYQQRRNSRPSTALLINILRYEIWSDGLLKSNFSSFASHSSQTSKPLKYTFPLSSSLFRAVN
jgi:hypothetical protein